MLIRPFKVPPHGAYVTPLFEVVYLFGYETQPTTAFLKAKQALEQTLRSAGHTAWHLSAPYRIYSDLDAPQERFIRAYAGERPSGCSCP